ncbi:hypothetical protein M758_6G007700 [Ceratodon purpureus]|nr:hypothetical protein M758_6G007700 [Ceratodon purpureus]
MSETQRAASLARIESIRASQLIPPDPERDEAVQAAWADIWFGIDSHVTDKQYYPRYVAYAVGHTVAQMVNVVCFARLNRMNGWDHPIPGQHLEEWDEDKECQLPPIDTWARQCIPVELKPKSETKAEDIDFRNRTKAFSKYRSSETVLASVQDALAQRRNSMQLQFQAKPKRRDSEPINVQVEADKFFSAAIAGWQKLPIEESSESEDETEAGSETSGDLNSSGEGGEGGEAPVPPA